MIKIVTIEREYGSGGGEIAQRLAAQLGWKLWDQLLTEEIAKLAECPKAVVEVREERTDPLYYRLFKSFLRGPGFSIFVFDRCGTVFLDLAPTGVEIMAEWQ
jgi:hypothetical protein